MSNPTPEIQFVDPSIKIHQFSDVVMETRVFFQIMCLKDSYFIWLDTNPKLSQLTFAIPTPFDKLPSVTQLIGEGTDGFSQSLATRLAKKYNKPFYISASLPQTPLLPESVEKRLLQELFTKIIPKSV